MLGNSESPQEHSKKHRELLKYVAILLWRIWKLSSLRLNEFHGCGEKVIWIVCPIADVCSWKERQLPVCVSCLLFVTFPVLPDIICSADRAYRRSADLWPVLSTLHAYLAFYLKISLATQAHTHVSVVYLLPWSLSVVLCHFCYSFLLWSVHLSCSGLSDSA